MGEEKKRKRRMGDRWDAQLLRDVDSMHFIMPQIMPNRADNEAFISECIDLTNVDAYLEKKNANNPEYKYNLFQVIVTTVMKAVTLRPKLNRFIANKNLYLRNERSASFIVKKVFEDNSYEGMALIKVKDEDTLETVHNEIYRQVTTVRNTEDDGGDPTTDAMNIFNKMPRFLSKFIISIFCALEKRGKIPKSLVATDPYYATVLFSNLGSIKLHSGYHHLANWGTNSIFVIVGERKMRPFYKEDGTYEMKDSVDIGMTIDERIADGYYYSKTIRLIKKLFECPELLDRPMNEEVDY